MAKNKFILYLVLAIASGIFLWLAWPPRHTAYIIFVAFVPLLLIEKFVSEEKKINSSLKIFLYTYLSFILWNYLTTFWIHHATLSGTLMTIVLNSLLMTFPVLLFHKIRIIAGKFPGFIALPSFWIAFEYLHLNWDLSWPWLSLGNVFALQIPHIQWYEFTGILGGTLWIWMVNLSLFNIIEYLIDYKVIISKKLILYRLLFFIIMLIFPFIVSKYITIPEDEKTGVNVVIVQPNIDPYNEKFIEGNYTEQLLRLIKLSEYGIDQNTRLLVWPETAISVSIEEHTLNDNPFISYIRSFLKKHPQVKLITGLDSYRFFEKDEKPTPTARIFSSDSLYYDFHNSALLLDSSENFEIYYKSKLVPGVEKMPYPELFRFLEKYSIKMGGTSGSLGKQDKPSVFRIDKKIVAAPAICYESIYGDYLGDFVLLGANIIVLITNDGWWGETDGYKQHFSYAALRAVELRKNIVRSANTGISGYINSGGKVLMKTDFWQPAVLKMNIRINNTVTFYAKHGDYIGRFAAILSGLILLFTILLFAITKKAHSL